MVALDCVVWVGDPEGGWRGVCGQQGARHLGEEAQVTAHNVAGLNAILKEERVTLGEGVRGAWGGASKKNTWVEGSACIGNVAGLGSCAVVMAREARCPGGLGA